MTDQPPLRPARRFDDLPEPPAPSLTGPRQFDASQVTHETEAATAVVDAALAAPPRRRGLALLCAAVVVLATVELVRHAATAVTSGAWWSLGWPLVGLAAVGLVGRTLWRELRRLRHLRRHGDLRDRALALQRSSGQRDSVALTEALRQAAQIPKDDLRWQTFLQGDQPHHTDAERLQRYGHHVLTPADREARQLVTRAAADVALVVAVSPLAWVDMAMMAWRTVRLLDRLARLYGLQLGYAARLRLFRTLLLNLAMTGMGELASDAAADLVALGIAGKVSTRLAQGLAAGLLTARLGLQAVALCRPLPFPADEKPRIGELRAELLEQLRALVASGRGGTVPEPAEVPRTR
ncbi:MAG: TIGR01620 family protein [Spongiibacteraceae bacterium]|jgi:putative membrane protein|nr:TIGR01620 family protein [Spongiibacteraceae bacterium]